MTDMEEYMKTLRREQNEIIHRMIAEKAAHKEGEDATLKQYNFKELLSSNDKLKIQSSKILEEKRAAKKKIRKELEGKAHDQGNKMRWEK